MKLFVVGAWIASFTLLGAGTAAAQQGGGKVAYVNTQAILKQTPGYAQAESTFAREIEAYRREVEPMRRFSTE